MSTLRSRATHLRRPEKRKEKSVQSLGERGAARQPQECTPIKAGALQVGVHYSPRNGAGTTATAEAPLADCAAQVAAGGLAAAHTGSRRPCGRKARRPSTAAAPRTRCRCLPTPWRPQLLLLPLGPGTAAGPAAAAARGAGSRAADDEQQLESGLRTGGRQGRQEGTPAVSVQVHALGSSKAPELAAHGGRAVDQAGGRAPPHWQLPSCAAVTCCCCTWPCLTLQRALLCVLAGQGWSR